MKLRSACERCIAVMQSRLPRVRAAFAGTDHSVTRVRKPRKVRGGILLRTGFHLGTHLRRPSDVQATSAGALSGLVLLCYAYVRENLDCPVLSSLSSLQSGEGTL
jgi:hypothetical protein